MLDLVEEGAVGLVDQVVALFDLEHETPQQGQHLHQGQSHQQHKQRDQEASEDVLEIGMTLVLTHHGLLE